MGEMTVGPARFVWGSRTYIMGILNVTPDSFSDGGFYAGADAALVRARTLVEEGADIIDVGGESTRPGAEPLDADAELARVLPVLPGLIGLGAPVSIDTYHAKTALECLRAGAHMINDIKGLEGEPEIADIAAQYRAAVCVMHSRPATGPRYEDVTDGVRRDLAEMTENAMRRGVAADRIMIDPGIGFGKTYEQNLELLRNLAALKTLGFPLLLGVSRKSVIGLTLGVPPEKRLEGTIAANVLGIAGGADMIRVHDAAPHRSAAAMADRLLRGREGDGSRP